MNNNKPKDANAISKWLTHMSLSRFILLGLLLVLIVMAASKLSKKPPRPITTNPIIATQGIQDIISKEIPEELIKKLPKQLTLDLGSDIEMKLNLIPAGKFVMGSPTSEKNRSPEEFQHHVEITTPFYMGIYEVTQAQHEAVTGKNPSHSKGNNKPVERVFPDDIIDFCSQLSQKTGFVIRLPTEAEWEYAARAGTTTATYGELDEIAWYRGNSDLESHPVGQKLPNDFGLYDMSGNVSELCNDWYSKTYYKNKDAKHNPKGPKQGNVYVYRGGSWAFDAHGCRSACRGWGSLSRSNIDGFRVVCEPSSQLISK